MSNSVPMQAHHIIPEAVFDKIDPLRNRKSRLMNPNIF